MSSILTNVSAMTALRSLQQTNDAMNVTQNRISTGMRVAEAADNAAYWSIATTMRSDNSALGTVQDALGLGASKVDVAYTGINSAKEAVDEIKVKLVAAREPGVDRSKIQSEIAQLQSQISGIAQSGAISGTNWLNVDSGSADYSATTEIVSSFNRAGDGSVSVGTITVDAAGIALFDAATDTDGLLEGGSAAQATSASAFDWTQGTFADGDSITLDVTVDGGSAQNVSITVADAANFSLADLVAGINEDITGATASASESGELVLTSTSTGVNASVELGNFDTTQADTTTDATIGFTAIAEATGTATGGGILDINITDASNADVDSWISIVDGMSEAMTTAAADLGAAQKRINMQSDFVSNLMDAIDRGVGQLVDADMSAESTKLQALQVQQQLGIQALSIANGNAQSILSLFR